jgi:hypothetical protein
MIFRVFDKAELRKLFNSLSAGNKIVGPVEKARDRDGNPLYAFMPVREFDDLRLDFTMTRLPAKRFFLPFSEDLATFSFTDGEWEKMVDYNAPGSVVLFGLHACDINALNRLDKVLMGSTYPMPYYAAKRKNMFIVGYDCMPGESCFCRSMGADTALAGFDLFITDLGDIFFAEILSGTAFELMRQMETREPGDREHALYKKHIELKNNSFKTRVDTTDLTKILDMEFQSGVWERWGQRCFSCGTCSNVCPTCYC